MADIAYEAIARVAELEDSVLRAWMKCQHRLGWKQDGSQHADSMNHLNGLMDATREILAAAYGGEAAIHATYLKGHKPGLSQMEKDAARYRFLTGGGYDTYSMFVEAKDKAALDAAIDAAMTPADGAQHEDR
jgi:hypothetical protein